MYYKYDEENCPHRPDMIIKEVMKCGFKTGDYICTGCGLTFAEKEDFKRIKNNKPQN